MIDSNNFLFHDNKSQINCKKKNEQKFYLHNLNSNISKKHDLCPVLVLSEEVNI